MRKQFVFDGTDGGQLSVIESTIPDRIDVSIKRDGHAIEIALTETDLREISALRFRLDFVKPEVEVSITPAQLQAA